MAGKKKTSWWSKVSAKYGCTVSTGVQSVRVYSQYGRTVSTGVQSRPTFIINKFKIKTSFFLLFQCYESIFQFFTNPLQSEDYWYFKKKLSSWQFENFFISVIIIIFQNYCHYNNQKNYYLQLKIFWNLIISIIFINHEKIICLGYIQSLISKK